MNDPFRFACGSLTGSAVRVLSFASDEELGQPFTLTAYVDAKADLADLEAVLGKSASLSVLRGAEDEEDTVFHGVLFEAELVLAVGERRIYRLTLAPEIRVLGIGHHSRVFVDKSVPEIIEAILKANGIASYELRLSGTYPARRHVCQYKESDLSFLHRWMEREGIYYYVLHDQDRATLIVCDDKSRHDDAPWPLVRYYPSGEDDVLAREGMGSWRRVHAAVTESVRLADYDYQRPARTIEASKARAAVGFEELVRFEDNLHDQREADRLIALRSEWLTSKQVRFHGRGHLRGLHVGLRFELQEHPREAFNQRYQLCRVAHSGSRLEDNPELERMLGLPPAKDGHHVVVEAQPADLQHRPERRAPWPEAHGVESAVIDGRSESPYAQIDEEGRYRVRLFFDEAKNPAGSASAWLRMLQPHGGAPEGHHFPLRKGTEVLVAFVHGDPDRPYIVGAAPTPKTPSPVRRANQTRNVIQTGSSNRLEIEDLEGQQYVDLSTPPESTFLHLGAHAGLGDHNIVVSTQGDGLHNAGGKRDITVGGVQTEDVTGDLIEEYSSNQSTHVFGSFTETIQSGKTQTISSGATQTIDGGLTQTIDGGETRVISGGLVETITGGRTQTIVGATTETIGGALTQTVSGFVDVSTPASYVLQAPASITMITPGAGILNGLGGVKMLAPGGQMTVDSWYQCFGDQNIVAYGIKLSLGVLRFSLTGNWTRIQFLHVAVYGVKIEGKAISVKKWSGKDEKFGALDAKARGLFASKNGTTQIS